MKKYIRTNNGRIYVSHDDLQIIDNTLCSMQNGRVWLVLGEVLKQADTIEELIQDGDLCHLAECQVCRDQISVVKVFPRKDYIGISVPGIEYSEDSVLELWIKDTNGNYIKVAQKETEEGELVLR